MQITDKLKLELIETTLIDQHSVIDLLAAIAEICEGKAEHLRHNWQDDNSARAWEHAASLIDKLTLKIDV